MIVISAGMQKSGTGWYFSLTNALLAGHGGDDTRVLRDQSKTLGRVVKTHNCSIGAPTARRVALFVAGGRGKKFAVKTHAAPTPALKALLSTHRAQATYCYRDLRDVALSALDAAGKQGDAQPGPKMAQLKRLEDAFRFTTTLVPVWRAWTSTPGVLPVRYEALVADPAKEIERLATFLGIALADGDTDQLLERYPAGAGGSATRKELHFNRGEAGRFHEVMTPADLEVCNRVIGPYLDEVGYERV
ncbi:hypothetical protein BH18ACT4_BH18ACT4_00950 [soil metagenome]